MTQLAGRIALFAVALLTTCDALGKEFRSTWPQDVQRPWIGPEC